MRSVRSAKVIVIGLGTFGAAALWALRGRGGESAFRPSDSVIGFDRFSPPHDRGEHAGLQRMFRMAYAEHPGYVPLLRRALELWRSVPTPPGGAPHLCMTGGVYAGPPEGELVGGTLRAAREHGLVHRILSAEEAHRDAAIVLPPGYAAMHEEPAGFLAPEEAVARMLRAAREGGADARTDETVLGWNAGEDGCVVRTAKGAYLCERLVIAAGPWAGHLLGDLKPMLRVSRQVQVWIKPKRPERFALGVFPCFAVDMPGGGLLYGFPMMPGSGEMKVAIHRPGETADPDAIDRSVRPEETDEVLREVERYLPEACGPVVRATVCMYTNSPDGHFVIDHHPGHARVVLACGFSGHGFKFAPAVGELLAGMALGGVQAPEFLRLSRFRGRA